MLSVGLTGGIASGKSTVAAMFQELGCHVIDSDQITHELLEPGQAVYEAVVGAFGPGILGPGGQIDRKALGAIVFRDPQQRQVLNGLVHPGVARRQEEFLGQVAKADPDGIAIVDAALMIETGSYRRYDRVVVVGCEPSEQRRRLRLRGRLTPGEIEARIESQMPLDEKVRYAGYVIDNSGSLEETRRQVRQVWEEMRTLAESR